MKRTHFCLIIVKRFHTLLSFIACAAKYFSPCRAVLVSVPLGEFLNCLKSDSFCLALYFSYCLSFVCFLSLTWFLLGLQRTESCCQLCEIESWNYMCLFSENTLDQIFTSCKLLKMLNKRHRTFFLIHLLLFQF